VVAGVLIALASWWLTGWALPLTGVVRPALPLPGAPHVFVPIGAGLAVLVILTGVAVITGRRTLSRIR
jgi:hypothetical protein